MPDTISFARGAPSLDIIDVEGLKACAVEAFDADAARMTGYGTSVGYVPLRQWIAEYHGVAPEQVLVTNGSMQADAFLFDTLVKQGDTVITELPTYDRTLLVLRGRQADVRMVELEPDGIDVAALERLLAAGARPKLAHVIPNFQNPAGYTLSLAKREALVELARTYGFVIFEDDPYVTLRFAGESLSDDALDGARRHRLRLLVLQDRVPGHPNRLPRRTGGPDRQDRRGRHLDLHLAEHGRRGHRQSVLPLGPDRQLDRHRPRGTARALAGAVRGARRAPPGRSLRRARGRLLPVGRPAPGHRRGRAVRCRRRARRPVRQGLGLRARGLGVLAAARLLGGHSSSRSRRVCGGSPRPTPRSPLRRRRSRPAGATSRDQRSDRGMGHRRGARQLRGRRFSVS